MKKYISKYISIVIFISFILRISFFIFIIYINPDFIYAPDSNSYIKPAITLKNYGFFGNGIPPYRRFETVRTPGYPLFLAFLYLIREDNKLVIFFQLVLSSIFLPILAFYIGRELNFSDTALKVFIWTLVLDPLLFIYNFNILTEELYALIILFLVFLLIKLIKSQDIKLVLLTSLILGLQAYVRPVGLYLPFFIFIYFTFIALIEKEYTLLYKVAIPLFIVSLIIINIWIYRNYKLTGIKEFSSIAEKNLLFYRASYVLHFKTEKNTEEIRKLLEKEFVQKTKTANMNSAESLKWARKKALEIFFSCPKETMKATLNGMFHLLVGPGASTYLIAFKLHKPHSGIVYKLNNMRILQFILFLFYRYKYLFLFNLLGGLYLLIIYFFSFFGFLKNIKNKKVWLVITIIFYYILISSGGEAYSRLRVPFEGLILIFFALYFNKNGESYKKY